MKYSQAISRVSIKCIYIKEGESTTQMSDYQLLKKDPAP
jgi:hypothetical protein